MSIIKLQMQYIIPAIKSNSNGDFLNTDEVWCGYRIGLTVTSARKQKWQNELTNQDL